MRKFLTTGTAGRLLGVSRERVGQLVREGRLPVAARDSTGKILLRAEMVERLRQEREEKQRVPRV